jgi:lipoprotein signal peptidase
MREMQAAGGKALTGESSVPEQRTSALGTSDAGATQPEEASSEPERRSRVLAVLAVAVLVLAADIISKTIVVATLSDRPPVSLLGGFLKLTVSRNPGAAFSIGTSVTVVFTAIAVGVITLILRASRRIRSTGWAISLGLLLGGATGNLIDRLLRAPGPFRGYVVDWIWLPHWPVFNLADSSIVCGGILAVLLAMRGVHIDGTMTTQPRTTQPGASERNSGDTT